MKVTPFSPLKLIHIALAIVFSILFLTFSSPLYAEYTWDEGSGLFLEQTTINQMNADCESALNKGGAGISTKDMRSVRSWKEIEQLLAIAGRRHPVFRNFNTDHYLGMLKDFPEIVDPLKIYLTESQVEIFSGGLDQKEKLKLIKEMNVDHDFSRFEKLVNQVLEGRLFVLQYLRQLHVSDQSLKKIVEEDDSENLAFASSREQMKLNILSILASSLKYYLNFGFTYEEAFDNARAQANKTVMAHTRTHPQERTWIFLAKAAIKQFGAHSDYHTPTEAGWSMFNSSAYVPLGVSLLDTLDGLKVINVTEGSLAQQSGIELGDELLEINSQSLRGVDGKSFRVFWASTLERLKGQKVTSKIKRGASLIELELDLNYQNVDYDNQVTMGVYKRKSKNFIHIHFPSFYKGSSQEIAEELQNQIEKLGEIHGIIIDLRSNGGGHLDEAEKIMALFSELPGYLWARSSRGVFTEGTRRQDLKEKSIFTGPKIVMINGQSASASELLAGTLKHRGNTIVVGSPQTFGKGTIQSLIPSLHGLLRTTVGFFHDGGGQSPHVQGVQSHIRLRGNVLFSDDHREGNLDKVLPVPSNLHLEDSNPLIKKRQHLLSRLLPILTRFNRDQTYDFTQRDSELLQSLDILEQWIHLRDENPNVTSN